MFHLSGEGSDLHFGVLPNINELKAGASRQPLVKVFGADGLG
jgi:hypothetical protein